MVKHGEEHEVAPSSAELAAAARMAALQNVVDPMARAQAYYETEITPLTAQCTAALRTVECEEQAQLPARQIEPARRTIGLGGPERHAVEDVMEPVPVDADLKRLRALPNMIEKSFG